MFVLSLRNTTCAGMHSDFLMTPASSRRAQGPSMHDMDRLEPGSGGFGAALAAAERASVTPARRVGRSLSHVSSGYAHSQRIDRHIADYPYQAKH